MDKVVHFEIPAEQVERAQKFYGEVFDWKINAIPEMKYTIVNTGPTDDKGMSQEIGFINGGMMKRNDMINKPVITIQVDSIEESAKKIVAGGGSMIMDKVAVSDMGFSAYFKDCEGNIMGLWENAKR